MFAKKLLSIVALLFLGGQSVNAGNCAPTFDGTSCTPGEDCTASDDSKLILVAGSGSVEGTNFVIEITDNEGAVECAKHTGIDGEDVCVDSDTKEITTDRLDCFCGGNTLYRCETSGECSTTLTLDCRTDGCDPVDNQTACQDGGYYLKSVEGVDTLFKCEGTTVSCIPQNGGVNPAGGNYPAIPRGYFANSGSDVSTKPYIQCNENECKNLEKTSITKTGCNDTGVKVGDLIFIDGTGYRLCTASDKPVELSSGKYLVTLEAESDNAFTDAALATNSIIVDTTSTTAIFNAIASNGNYIIDANKALVSTAAGGSLVQCSGDIGTCLTPTLTGYFKNVETTHINVPYISCVAGVCTGYKPGTDSDCSSKNPGDIINPSESNYKLCVEVGGSKIEVPLTTSTTTVKYMVAAEKAKTSNPFYTIALDSYYIVVDIVAGTDVVTHNRDGKKYRYTDATQRIYDDGTADEAITPDGAICNKSDGTIVEYTIDYCIETDNYDYYSQGTPKPWSP